MQHGVAMDISLCTLIMGSPPLVNGGWSLSSLCISTSVLGRGRCQYSLGMPFGSDGEFIGHYSAWYSAAWRSERLSSMCWLSDPPTGAEATSVP